MLDVLGEDAVAEWNPCLLTLPTILVHAKDRNDLDKITDAQRLQRSQLFFDCNLKAVDRTGELCVFAPS